MQKKIDLLIISPGNGKIIYQELASEYAAIEPPIWAGLLANFARSQGFSVEIIDQEAQGLSIDEIAKKTIEIKPRLTAIVVYGQQPSASTQNMTVSEEIANSLNEDAPDTKTILIGGHVSALPERTLDECKADFVCQGEGPYTINALLSIRDMTDESELKKVPGLWYRNEKKNIFSFPADLVPQNKLATTLPGNAWDLLPMNVYRAHNWHCFTHIQNRKPYASIYTSLGCPYHCSFCCINAPFGRSGIRYWDPNFVIEQLDLLANNYNIQNIKIADEMFVLNEDHVMRLCNLIIERGYKFNFWAYARVDSVKDKFLEKLKSAGFNWLCVGIESGSKHVRDGVEKGRFVEEDIVKSVSKIRNSGIFVIGNYIFGLPDDDYDSMQATLDLAIELNCEMANFYSASAYPGSKLYEIAIEKGLKLPGKWQDYSQHSFEQLPLPTEKISAGEVLSFRDKAWQVYFTSDRYLDMIEKTFGIEVVEHIKNLAKVTLKRRYAAPLKKEPCYKRMENGVIK